MLEVASLDDDDDDGDDDDDDGDLSVARARISHTDNAFSSPFPPL